MRRSYESGRTDARPGLRKMRPRESQGGYVMNREQWLTELAEAMRPAFKQRGLDFGAFRVACGFPGGGSARKRIGECWPQESSADGITEVFVSPLLADRWAVAGTLAHELVHAAVGCKCGHKGAFVKGIRAIGLEGKPTQAGNGEEFRAWATPLVEAMPDYPHGALSLTAQRKQSTRLIKAECHACEYIVRLSRKTFDMGAPLCGVCHEPMEESV